MNVLVIGVGALGLGLLWYVLSKAQKENDEFDLVYWIVDPNVGKITAQSMGMFIALLVSSFVVLGLFFLEKWDALITALGLYMASWAGAKVLNDWTAKPKRCDDDKDDPR